MGGSHVDEQGGQQPAANLYQTAGVDTHKADLLVGWLQGEEAKAAARNLVPSTRWGEPVAGIGGFASLFRLRLGGMQDPLLVATTDGVGTKVLLALAHGQLSGLGIDLVAMCANDLVTLGAHPLFFLDYYATGELEPAQFKDVLAGIRSGLAQCGASLLGGETAEMPGLYQKHHLDLAGFMVGVVDNQQRLGEHRVRAGDVLVGFAASGFHSNGYSLLRHWLAESPREQADAELVSRLLAPTKIYAELPRLAESLGAGLHAAAHITGGGIPGNLPRVIPADLRCNIAWPQGATPAWMHDFITSHTPSLADTLGVFNLGIGMVVCVDSLATAMDCISQAASFGSAAWVLGNVVPRTSAADPSVAIHFN